MSFGTVAMTKTASEISNYGHEINVERMFQRHMKGMIVGHIGLPHGKPAQRTLAAAVQFYLPNDVCAHVFHRPAQGL